ncbi:MAG: IS1595 family transposase [Alloprevotella sp.]|nr:IS1595 family transposase [Alloprevotella sp.]
MKIDFTQFDSLFSVMEYFTTDQICKQAIAQSRWSDGDVVCPYCGSHHCHLCKDGRYLCKHCNHKFNVTVGTIFENTKISLRKWFIAMYLISSHKKGIASHQLARDIKVTQKTAWFILHKVRTLYGQTVNELSGEVECDEAYIGGREKNKHESKKTEGTQGRSTKTKTPVFGMIERGGKLVAKKVKNTKGNTLSPIIRQIVKPGSRIFTDEFIGYHSLYDSEYTHAIVHHNAKEFVVGDAYTNSIEGFWGQLKRSIFGIYHFVSAKYLQRYVDEAVFRYNTRDDKESVRFMEMFGRSLNVVRYDKVKKVA